MVGFKIKNATRQLNGQVQVYYEFFQQINTCQTLLYFAPILKFGYKVTAANPLAILHCLLKLLISKLFSAFHTLTEFLFGSVTPTSLTFRIEWDV